MVRCLPCCSCLLQSVFIVCVLLTPLADAAPRAGKRAVPPLSGGPATARSSWLPTSPRGPGCPPNSVPISTQSLPQNTPHWEYYSSHLLVLLILVRGGSTSVARRELLWRNSALRFAFSSTPPPPLHPLSPFGLLARSRFPT